ncbi:MAG TPA: DUF721 domain-containing protein [Acidimicrobiales bacterium]|nr:DUF721 domain-containing protein [Acidimicrobiales bacterium]
MSGSTWHPAGGSGDAPDGDQPRTVGESLQRISRSLGGTDAGVVGTVFAHWEEAVGAAIADHAKPLSLRDGVLVVGVGEPAWATQLRFLERQILERLRDAAGREVATRIEVRVRPSGGGRRGSG